MVTEPLTDTEDTLDTLEDISKAVDVAFESTGDATRDRALKGIFSDAPLLVRTANKMKVWDTIRTYINPVVAAEKFAVQSTLPDLPEAHVPCVVKAVKRFLIGINLSVLQAYQKNVLVEHLKRVDIAKAVAKYSPKSEFLTEADDVKTEVPVVKEVTTVVKVGNTLVSSDGHTYTIGARGRKPAWVENLPEVIPTQDVAKAGNTLIHKDGHTYTIGARGRKPAWVVDWESKSK